MKSPAFLTGCIRDFESVRLVCQRGLRSGNLETSIGRGGSRSLSTRCIKTPPGQGMARHMLRNRLTRVIPLRRTYYQLAAVQRRTLFAPRSSTKIWNPTFRINGLSSTILNRLGYHIPIIPQYGSNTCFFHSSALVDRETPTATDNAGNSPSAEKKFTYTVGVAFRPKDEGRQLGGLRKEHGKEVTPSDSGEDGYFAVSSTNSQNLALGVTDGVGGWSLLGVDPAEFSHTLCEKMLNSAQEQFNHSESESVDPGDLLTDAFLQIEAEGKIKAGGSTACVGVINEKGALRVANLGDSGFYIFRHGRVFHTSHVQTHYFNAPFQLAIIPESVRKQVALEGGKHFEDSPKDADQYSLELQHGDVIVFVTDGLSDNLSVQESLQIVNEGMVMSKSWLIDQNHGYQPSPQMQEDGAQAIAKRLVSAAYQASVNQHRDGPFARDAQKYLHALYKGGKPDDITVVAVLVQ